MKNGEKYSMATKNYENYIIKSDKHYENFQKNNNKK